jgi:AraC family transcriptional regulator of adaptative response/methylated-DNA-[protein]-cysteine methyltransferase
MVVAWSERGVALVEFLDDESAAARVRQRFPHAEQIEAPEAGPWVAAVLEVVAGRASPETVPLDIRGTAFQRRVWEALRTLRPGERVSYGELAARIGRPEAARAVAGACGANRHAVLVPCHRVVAADGGLGGYRWGRDRKRALLEAERDGDSGAGNDDGP